MKSDEELLTAEQKQRELDVISECFRLMQSERSRYEKQAIAFIDSGHFSTETNSYSIKFLITNNQFACIATSKVPNGDSHSTFAPIPESRDKQIEELIELFAQSEAGLIL